MTTGVNAHLRFAGHVVDVTAPVRSRPVPRTIDELLAEARSRLVRVGPAEAAHAAAQHAVLVDIRPVVNQATEGTIAGALVVERNVLEWRFDPRSSAALPIADHDLPVIVFCNEGYTSSLAARALQELGVWRATDMIGGYRAWRAAGLPVVPPVSSARLP